MARKAKEETGKALTTPSSRLANALAYGKAASSGGSIIGKLLVFNKGEWYAGQENEEIPVGTKVVWNPDSAMAGWTRWENKKPVEELLGGILDGFQPERRENLGYIDRKEWETDDNGEARDPWSFGNKMLFKSVGKSPELFTFTTGSKGGLGAVGKLMVDYAEACMERGQEDDYPIIELGARSYMHPEYKKIWTPQFRIVGWQPKDEWEIPEAATKAPAASKKRAGSKQLNY